MRPGRHLQGASRPGNRSGLRPAYGSQPLSALAPETFVSFPGARRVEDGGADIVDGDKTGLTASQRPADP